MTAAGVKNRLNRCARTGSRMVYRGAREAGVQHGGERNGRVAGAGSLPTVRGSTLGIVANPMSGRDIRRLVAQASVFPNAEKTNMVLRLIAAAGAAGVDTVLMSTDTMGVAGGVLRAQRKRRAGAGRWPEVEFVGLEAVTGTAHEPHTWWTRCGPAAPRYHRAWGRHRAACRARSVRSRAAAATGTNNAFQQVWEATVAGTASACLPPGGCPRGGRLPARCCGCTGRSRRDRAGRRWFRRADPRGFPGALAPAR